MNESYWLDTVIPGCNLDVAVGSRVSAQQWSLSRDQPLLYDVRSRQILLRIVAISREPLRQSFAKNRDTRGLRHKMAPAFVRK